MHQHGYNLFRRPCILLSEWIAIAQERKRQIESGEVAPIDGEQVLQEMRQLAKQLAQ
jgi:hypothetical protein